MNAYYQEILDGKEVRKNLIELKQLCKETEYSKAFLRTYKDELVFTELLEHEDAKVRKNAALIIGLLGLDSEADTLFACYLKEQTRFVKSAYLEALLSLDTDELAARIYEQYEILLAYEPAIDEVKHIAEEKRLLSRIAAKHGYVKKHTFCGYDKEHTCIFTTAPVFRNSLTEALTKRAKEALTTADHPFGVMARTSELSSFLNVRSYREVLFILKGKKRFPKDADAIAKGIIQADLLSLLKENHEEDGPFFFRIELRSSMTMEEKSAFTKKLALALEKESKGMLENSTTDYELEIRLVENKEGELFPCVKLYTIPDHRFDYRKVSLATSMHPATAAALVELASDYLIDDAVVLDPFCGVGTLLIERGKKMRTYDRYGVDIFGDAIVGAHENADSIDAKIHFINRDYGQFTSKHQMDEIWADFPMRGKKTKEEQDELYQMFFRQSESLLKPHGRMFLYSNEMGFVKKQLRLYENLKLKKEIEIRKKDGFSFYIIEKI